MTRPPKPKPPAENATTTPPPSPTNAISLTLEVDSEPLEQAIKWIVAGNTETEVITSLKDQFPDHDADAVCALAAAKIIEAGKIPAAFIRGLVVLGLLENHRKGAEMGDIAGSTRALKLLHDIAGK